MMKNAKKQAMGKKGFTLIEVLIVVIILGILASIAIPQYAKSIEKAKMGEAKTNLGSILTGEKLYYLEYEIYRNAACVAELNSFLDVEISENYFTYVVTGATDTVFTAIATRSSGQYSGNTVSMTEKGAVTEYTP